MIKLAYVALGFWVGADGDSGIAQNGIIVSCVQGQPEYHGNFDNLSGTIVQYEPQPMYPGDTVQSSVICWFGLCAETNQDITQNWTGYYVMIVPGGGFSGLVGAVVGESSGGGVTTGTVQVTNAMVNGTPIGQQNAQNIVQNPANYGSTASLVPTPLDATGMGFQLSWNATTGS
jgi:hypothetical protein